MVSCLLISGIGAASQAMSLAASCFLLFAVIWLALEIGKSMWMASFKSSESGKSAAKSEKDIPENEPVIHARTYEKAV
jgi:hypothetical protein